MTSLKVLMVGGAGYIGSICARVFADAGATVWTLDDLSTGHEEAVTGELVHGSILERSFLIDLLKRLQPDAVMHFAARSLVGESVNHPLAYYDTNVRGTLNLLTAMQAAGVNRMVFSSTCAIYGPPRYLPIDEAHPIGPISPYGDSKEMIERILSDCRAREGFQITTLRYFNAAGAMPDGSLGEAHDPETHLIPLALDALLDRRPPLKLFGRDYDTRDGTCIRDYVHVLDLAEAHRLALARLLDGDPGASYNLGTERGTTVSEILNAIARVAGRPVPYKDAPRRPGDPPALFAASAKAREELGWRPAFTDIDDIIRTALAWAQTPRYGRYATKG
ncbi:MAG: UDP-glucose 4-epimerase GalE [Myxococcota bacterium]